MNITRCQDSDNKESEHAQQHAVGSQVADADQRVLVRHDNAGVLQAHHADKQPDTAGDTHAQAHRDIGNHPVAYAEEGQQQQADGAPENRAHTHLPRQAHRLNYHEGKEGIQTHRWRQRHRQIREQTHQNAAEGRDQTGGHKDSAGIHTRHAKNLWVHEDDVDHRQERGETGDRFSAHRGAVLAQFKYALQQTLARRLAGWLLTHYRFPNVKEGKFEAILYQITAPGAVVW